MIPLQTIRAMPSQILSDHLPEPRLQFAYGQSCEHPKDGLFLFGPYDSSGCQGGVRYGTLGTTQGIERFRRWVGQVRSTITPEKSAPHLTTWPGFSAAFGVDLPASAQVEIALDAARISEAIRRADRHAAVHETVSLFESTIRHHLKHEEERPDVWFVVIPEEVYRHGRPESSIPKAERTGGLLGPSARSIARAGKQGQQFLFPEDARIAEYHEFELNFHNQLKARLLDTGAVIQIVRETTIAPYHFLKADGKPVRRVDDASTIAWNLCTAIFFKAQGKPWKLASVRDGVCYVGIVYKKLHAATPTGNACCGAQMFLDSGDGVVFKGLIGPWYSEATKQFHLTQDKAAELMRQIIEEYSRKHGAPPRELFLHAPSHFVDEEWEGFLSAAPKTTAVTGVRIRRDNQFKLYLDSGSTPVLRGTLLRHHEKRAHLWSLGYVPRLKTYPGWEVPSPLEVSVSKGDADIYQVCADVLSLTKLNFNACIYGDGIPVTLRFAHAVGEILTAAPTHTGSRALSFRYYI